MLTLFGSLPFLFGGIAFTLALGLGQCAARRLLITMVGVAGPVLLLIAYYALNDWIGISWIETIYLFAIVVGAITVWRWFINVYQISSHRRYRNRLIIAIDGEADPEMAFPSLMQLIRFAQIDVGIRIDLADLAKNQAEYSEARFVLGTIEFGDDQTGYLRYIKSSLTGNERDYILDYRRAHPPLIQSPAVTRASSFQPDPWWSPRCGT